MKSLSILLFCFLCFNLSFGQGKFLTKNGHVSFFSESPMENITADNKQVLSIIDASKGTLAISILMKSFMFEKSLMQEHFNENYVESDKFPKAIFKGQILNFDALKNKEQEVMVKGKITIHGVTKNIETKAMIHKTEQSISLKGSFAVKVADFDIEIPSVVTNNIAETIAITFELDHLPYKK